MKHENGKEVLEVTFDKNGKKIGECTFGMVNGYNNKYNGDTFNFNKDGSIDTKYSYYCGKMS